MIINTFEKFTENMRDKYIVIELFVKEVRSESDVFQCILHLSF